MTDQLTVEQKNEVIALFDGWEPRLSSKGQHSRTPLWYKPSAGYAAWDLSAMKYHTSWEWLMPCWYKFIDLRFPDPMLQFKHSELKTIVGYAILYGGIEMAHNNLYEAIQWYNTQKEKQ